MVSIRIVRVTLIFQSKYLTNSTRLKTEPVWTSNLNLIKLENLGRVVGIEPT